MDNFAPVNEQQYWSQRYWVNEDLYGGEGHPVFLYIGGEGPESPNHLTSTMYMYTLVIMLSSNIFIIFLE